MIYMVSEIYYPEEISTGYILTKIAEGVAQNYPVHVITGPPDYSGKKIVPDNEVRNKVSIERVKSIDLDKNKLSTRLLRSIILSFKLVYRTFIKVKKGDVIFVVTNPAPLLILMSLVSKITRSRLVILVHDVFPENLVVANFLKKDSFFYKVLLVIFNKIYASADQVIVIGRDMKLLMEEKTKSSHPQINIITNWADVSDITPTDRMTNPLLQKLKIENKFIVQFAGNLGRVQGVDQLVEAAIALREENIHFLFIGDGARKKWLLQQVSEKKLENITCLDFLPREQQQIFLNACDVGLVSLAPGMTGLGVPSKTYNILAAAKPVIAIVDSKSEIGMLVNEEKIGWVVSPGSTEEMINAIKLASKADLVSYSNRAREVAVKKYSLDVIIKQYLEALKKVVK